LVRKLKPVEHMQFYYEGGPTGYVLYWQLTALGSEVRSCSAIACAEQARDRVKTDRRDAGKLARSYRAGDLTAVWVPDAAHEALDLLFGPA
jgi:transposase